MYYKYFTFMTLGKVLTIEAFNDKEIAVIPTNTLFKDKQWMGVKEMNEEELFKLLSRNILFKERSEELEKNPRFKQIIPYFVVKNDGKYLYAQRRDKTGDIRLHNSGLVGFGGHLKAGDIQGSIQQWLQREFSEEVKVSKIDSIRFIGAVNADSDADNGVHLVHIGLLFEITRYW